MTISTSTRLRLAAGLALLLAVGAAIESAEGLVFGEATPQIGTFGGTSLWVGWDASFSETYLPESESYAWVVYLAPEGAFVALQSSQAVYSAVDVYAGYGYFVGLLTTPSGGPLTDSYVSQLASVTLSTSMGVPASPFGPFQGLSVAFSSGMSFFRIGSSNTLARAIQYNAGASVSYNLAFSFPFGVSLGTPGLGTFTGFYPIIEWNVAAPGSNPLDAIVAELGIVASAAGNTFPQQSAGYFAERLLDVLPALRQAAPLDAFLDNATGTSEVDATIGEVEQWLQSGDTGNLPTHIQPPLAPDQMVDVMRPAHAATQAGFELGYWHSYNASGSTYKTYADCVTPVSCTAGQPCQVAATAQEMAALVPGSVPGDFEGAWVAFDKPVDTYLLSAGEFEWVQVAGGRAVYEFVQDSNIPLFLGVLVQSSDVPNGQELELCRRAVSVPEPSAGLLATAALAAVALLSAKRASRTPARGTT